MLQFALKNFIKYRLSPDFSVDKVEETTNKNIGYGHQINDTVVYTFGLAIVRFTFQGCPTHGALGIGKLWLQQEY